MPNPGKHRRLTDRMGKILESAFRKASEAISQMLSKSLTEGTVLEALTSAEWETTFTTPLLEAWNKVAKEAVIEAAIQELGTRDPSSIRLVERAASVYALQNGASRVRAIVQRTRLALRASIIQSINNGDSIYTTSKKIEAMVGLTERHGIALNRYRDQLNEKGLKDSEIESRIERKRNQLLRYRARNIARTETNQALSSGRIISWRAQIEAGDLPTTAKKKWIKGPEPVCPICIELESMDPIPVTDAWSSTIVGRVFSPPSHPSCRCDMILVFDT